MGGASIHAASAPGIGKLCGHGDDLWISNHILFFVYLGDDDPGRKKRVAAGELKFEEVRKIKLL